jgi:hypothetical protein
MGVSERALLRPVSLCVYTGDRDEGPVAQENTEQESFIYYYIILKGLRKLTIMAFGEAKWILGGRGNQRMY